MPSLARHPFWLDGGYDSDSVKGCRHHPNHDWWVFRIGDVLDCERSGRNPDELMVICRACYVLRCGHTNDLDPCMLHRHHEGLHVLAGGTRRDSFGNESVPAPKEETT